MRSPRRRKTKPSTLTAFETLEQRAMLAGLGQDSSCDLGSTADVLGTGFSTPPVIVLTSDSSALETTGRSAAPSSPSGSHGSQSTGPVFVSGAGLPKGTSTAGVGSSSYPSGSVLLDHAGSGTGSSSTTIGSRSSPNGGALASDRAGERTMVN